MDNLTITIISGIISLLVTIISGLYVTKVNRHRDKIEELNTEVIKLKTTTVNENHVRRIVKEELEPLTGTLQKMANSMHTVEVYIAEERGFKAGKASVGKP